MLLLGDNSKHGLFLASNLKTRLQFKTVVILSAQANLQIYIKKLSKNLLNCHQKMLKDF